MKKFNLTTLFFAFLLFVFCFSTAKAQDEIAPNPAANKNARPNLLAELGLSPDQVEQIKRVNQEKKPLMRDAQQRQREANRLLDEAIYADQASETEIQSRLKEVQLAHAEVLKIRSMTEFAVRKILTPEQLVKFREVRQKFMQSLETRPTPMQNRPVNNNVRQLNKLQRKLQPNN